MFRSLCTMRSSQCATLIALAAAAGIMRVEAAPEHADPKVQSENAQVTRHGEHSVSTKSAHFQSALAGIAPWLAVLDSTMNPASDCAPMDESPPLLCPRVADHPLLNPAALLLLPSPRERWFPYAVGPPSGGPTSTPRAKVTIVHGDSFARWRKDSRIATEVFLPVLSAQRSTKFRPCNGPMRYPNPKHAPRGVPDGLAVLIFAPVVVREQGRLCLPLVQVCSIST